jgi:phosphocarrier protein
LARSETVTICNQRGLHARASAKFVAEAEKYQSQITVTKDGETVMADSIMELLMLAAGPGTEITISADGGDSDQAISALKALIECGFNEET